MTSWRAHRAAPVAIITGAAGGMGMASARRFGAGMRLVLTDIREESLEGARAVLQEEGMDCTTLCGDLRKPETCQGLVALATSRGRLAVTVHTAGISPSMSNDPLEMIDVNLVATTHLLDALEPRLPVGAVAVCIASVSAYRHIEPAVEAVLLDPLGPDFAARLNAVTDIGSSTRYAYALAKRGVQLQCERRARDWGFRGARICSVSPGGTLTRMVDFERNRGGHQFVERTALGRRAAPEELAAAIAFLASEDASYITGCDLLVDGGVRAGTLHHASDDVRSSWLDASWDELASGQGGESET